MAEWLVTTLLEKLGPLIKEEISLMWGVEEELEKLQDELKTIHEVLADAERKQFTSAPVQIWLKKLKDVAYDAEDMIDVFRAEAERHKKPATSSPVCNFIFCFFERIELRHDHGYRIKEINQRLNEVSSTKERYNLNRYHSSVPRGTGGGSSRHGRQTTSAIIESDIVGRIDDAMIVVDWLVKDLDEREGNVNVVSVFGMGGLGKTTIAQKVLCDTQVQRHFEKVMWVCVSENPNKGWLAAKVLEAIRMNGEKVSQDTALNVLHTEISTHIEGRKFLLVLDDVWDLDWWEDLKATLQKAESGSRVLITTRNIDVSDRMAAIYSHPLKVLSQMQSWALFLKKVLKRNEVEMDLESVKDIGESIVERCKGLPLAIKAMGTIMSSKSRTRDDWDAVKNNIIWSWKPSNANEGHLFPILFMSFNDLPSYLKPCFLYCSIFPKDYEFDKNHIVRLWMSEGFISEAEGEMETKADEYVEELANRSMILAEKTDGLNGEILKFKMHDLMHDLALNIRGQEYSSSPSGDSNTRIVSMVDDDEKSLEDISAQKRSKVRTLVGPRGKEFPKSFGKNFPHLRVLDLWRANISEIPESIGELLLLKYLKVSRETKSLNESIGKLSNLQTLDLHGSQISNIPQGVLKLCNLRHMDLDNTIYLRHLPAGFAQLTNLRTLTQFILGRTAGSGEANITELRDLNSLRGNLAIYFIDRIRSEEAAQANLKGKHHLRSMKLVAEKGPQEDEGALETLLPPRQLEILEIVDYRGRSFPNGWFSSCNFPNLRKLKLDSLPFLEILPPLGVLPSLLILRISDAEKVVKAHESFTGKKQGGFEKLKQLTFERMKDWEEWVMEMEQGTMASLFKLSMIGCPKLRALPYLASLKQLIIIDCDNLSHLPDLLSLSELKIRKCKTLASLPDLPSLVELNIDDTNGLTTLPRLRNLQELEMYRCRSLTSLPEMNGLICMSIRFCDQLECFPKLSSIKELDAEYCPRITHLPCYSPLVRMDITNFPKLEAIPSMPCLRKLEIKHCRMLKELSVLPVAKELSVTSCPELETLPHFPRMKRLAVTRCPGLRMLWPSQEPPDELHMLEINDCLALDALPDEVDHLRRLNSLTIIACPALRSKYQTHATQEDLNKISHVRNVHISVGDAWLDD